MPLTEKQHKLCLDSYAKAKALDDTLGTQGLALYHNIFAAAPAVKPMFSFGGKTGDDYDAALKNQGIKTFVAIEKTLADPASAENDANLKKMGTGHVDLGVKAEHFPVVEDALIKTLSEALGGDWNADHEAAWRAAYNTVADKLKAGM